MKPLVVCSNMLNEIDQLKDGWLKNMQEIADAGIVIVDGGSTDGTLEFFKEKGARFVFSDSIPYFSPKHNHLIDGVDDLLQYSLIVVLDNIIQEKGYAAAHPVTCTPATD